MSATTPESTVYIWGCATREKYFQEFEFECWDNTRTTLIGTERARAAYHPNLEIWQQDEIALFPGLETGTVYQFRGRVRAIGGLTSTWSDWAAETAGDAGAPAPTYTVAVAYSPAGARITVTPSAVDADFDHYELFFRVNISTAPLAGTLPTLTPVIPPNMTTGVATFDFPMMIEDLGYAWIRAIDTSGNRQTWVQLHPGGGFSMKLPNVTTISLTQSWELWNATPMGKLTFQYTAPSDARFAGVEIWMTNHNNAGRTQLAARAPVVTPGGVNTTIAYVPIDYAAGSLTFPTTSHTVTFTLVSWGFDFVVNPLAGSPTVNTSGGGVHGNVPAPNALTTVGAYIVGTSVQIGWLRDSAPATYGYNIYREFCGSRSSPDTPAIGNAIRINTSLQVPSASGATPELRWFDRGFSILDFKPDDPTRLAYWVAVVNVVGQESDATLANNAAFELLQNAPGETGPDYPTKYGIYNLFFNAGLFSGVSTANAPFPYRKNGTYSAATPTRVTITAHGYFTGNTVHFRVTSGGWAGTRDWIITVIDANNFDLDGSNPGGLSGNCDTWGVKGQPPPVVSGVDDNCSWVEPTGGMATPPAFVSDGTQATEEVELVVSNVMTDLTSEIEQTVRWNRFTNGMHVCLSFFAKKIGTVSGNVHVTIYKMTINGAGTSVFTATFSSTLLTTSYQRFAYNVALGSWSGYSYLVARIGIGYLGVGGAATARIDRPMLNAGDYPSPWKDGQPPRFTTSPGSAADRPDPSTLPWDRTVRTIIKIDAPWP